MITRDQLWYCMYLHFPIDRCSLCLLPLNLGCGLDCLIVKTLRCPQSLTQGYSFKQLADFNFRSEPLCKTFNHLPWETIWKDSEIMWKEKESWVTATYSSLHNSIMDVNQAFFSSQTRPVQHRCQWISPGNPSHGALSRSLSHPRPPKFLNHKVWDIVKVLMF